ARLRRVVALLRAAREVELRERRVVRVRVAHAALPARAAEHLRQPRPERARLLPLPGFFAVDRSGGDEAALLHLAAGGGDVARERHGARAVDVGYAREEAQIVITVVRARLREVPG